MYGPVISFPMRNLCEWLRVAYLAEFHSPTSNKLILRRFPFPTIIYSVVALKLSQFIQIATLEPQRACTRGSRQATMRRRHSGSTQPEGHRELQPTVLVLMVHVGFCFERTQMNEVFNAHHLFVALVHGKKGINRGATLGSFSCISRNQQLQVSCYLSSPVAEIGYKRHG